MSFWAKRVVGHQEEWARGASEHRIRACGEEDIEFLDSALEAEVSDGMAADPGHSQRKPLYFLQSIPSDIQLSTNALNLLGFVKYG